MVSRKKNKGKERKAKKAEKEVETLRTKRWMGWQGLANGELNGGIITHCDHGCGVIISDNEDSSHPVSCFMDTFFINMFEKMLTTDILADALLLHGEMLMNDVYRKIVIKIMIRIGTNLMLANDWFPRESNAAYVAENNAAYVAQAIALLENYDVSMETTLSNNGVASKMRDLSYVGSSTRRDVLKFLSKRVTCSCLKEMYSQVRKTLPKMGRCHNCQEVKLRRLLLVCSRCRVNQFCSRQCHFACWPVHQKYCDTYASAHEQN